MKITNTIGWESAWLRKMIRFVCKELDYPTASIVAAHFSLCHNGAYRGKAYCGCGTIRAKINPLNTYPVQAKAHRGLPELIQVDALEILVRVTAHEVAHLERYDRFVEVRKARGGRDTFKEQDTERLARRVLQRFRDDRESLLAAWGEAGPGPVPPSVVHVLTCPRCGYSWRYARPPSNYLRRSCCTCFRSGDEAAACGQFLTYSKTDTVPQT